MQTPMKGAAAEERRKEQRYDTGNCTADILMAEPEITCQGIVVDVSRSGLRLRTDRRLEAQRLVTVRIGNITVAGRICHCRQNEAGSFDTGVLICDTDQG